MWSPWRYVPDRQSALDPGEAAETLRRTICLSVAARVSPHAHSVLLLSGGLDSSIIAAALARWQCAATGLTMVTRDLSGDERSYASATATHLSLPLHEIYRDLGAVDVTRSRAAGLPYPSERSFTQATSAAAEALAAATGASAILHGGGGDNVFASVQSAAPVTDLIRRGHIGPRLWRTTASIATLAHATHAAVIGQAITRLARRGPAYRWQPSCELLSDDGNARADEAVRHPWLDSPPGALPGSATHIANILRAIGIVQSPDARAPLPSIAVLMAQPIVEACLAIPSWYWVDRGHNRAVGRHAFADMLPNAIAWRRSKGAPDSFTVDLYEANRDLLRDFVLEGRLAASGLIDRDAVARELARRGPTRDRQYGRILQFADVEAWLQSWL
nr:asparagine synthase-related protein [Hephaestia sp. MAHUQ-44]